MNPLSGLIAPLLALLPGAPASPESAPDPRMEMDAGLAIPAEAPAAAPEVESFSAMARTLREDDAARQVRIEQRLIIRIAPGAPPRDLRDPRDMRRSLFADLPTRAPTPRMAERKMNQCVQVGAISGVQPDGPTRLMLFMRDQKIVSASLEKTCNARDFYSGFLVERSTDGMICAGRDRLLSRSGSNCALGKFRQLVAVESDDDE
jgi:hypothetical protein